jgi:putative endonuclease
VGERVYYVYVLASRIGGTLYIGVTGDLVRRVYEHREKLRKGFTEKYGIARLVYFER